MVDRKLFKTKLCVLYQKGFCGRQSCSFAHGEAELRRFSASHNVRRVNRSNDLRARLDRRRSPQRNYSPGRGARDHHGLRGYSPQALERRNQHPSPPPLSRPTKTELRKHWKRQKVVGQNEFSGSFRGVTEDQGGEDRLASSDSRDILQEQLKQVKCDINLLVEQKHQLEVELEESTQEADSLSSRIQDLETQLIDEKENCRRVTSKIKKFIRAHSHHTKLQDDLKRSQVRLSKLVEDLNLDAVQPGANEEDSSINIISDGEYNANQLINRVVELKKDNASPAKRRHSANLELAEGSKSGPETLRSGHYTQVSVGKESEVIDKRKAVDRPLSNEGKRKRRKDTFKDSSSDKVKGLDSNLVVPATGMAAHAADEFIELAEADDKTRIVETVSRMAQNGVAHEVPSLTLPLPPLPPISENNYAQFKGDDEDVDVDGLDEELVEVDIV